MARDEQSGVVRVSGWREQEYQPTHVGNVDGDVVRDTLLSAPSVWPEKAFLAHSRTLVFRREVCKCKSFV